MGAAGPHADWRDAEAYAPLLGADRSIFAWEWLRRDPGYRAAAAAAGSGGSADSAGSWGLHRFEDPDWAAPASRPLWRADRHGLVLEARAGSPSSPGDAVDLPLLPGFASWAEGADGREHWLLSDGLRAIRLDLVEGSATHGPVELHYLLYGRASLAGPLLTLRRLASLIETGRFAAGLHAPEPRARRWVLALRAHDALAAGAGQRDIAAGLLSAAAGEARWRVHEASLRSRAQRLARSARAFAAGGWHSFLE